MAFSTTFTVDATIKTDLQSALHLANLSDVPAVWDNIITKSRLRAYGDIVSALLGRGFTMTVVSAWDRGSEFERDLALWWTLNEGATLGAYDDKMLSKLDRREELKTVIVTTGASSGTPALEPSGQIGQGYLDDSRSTFKRQVDDQGEVDETAW